MTKVVMSMWLEIRSNDFYRLAGANPQKNPRNISLLVPAATMKTFASPLLSWIIKLQYTFRFTARRRKMQTYKLKFNHRISNSLKWLYSINHNTYIVIAKVIKQDAKFVQSFLCLTIDWGYHHFHPDLCFIFFFFCFARANLLHKLNWTNLCCLFFCLLLLL